MQMTNVTSQILKFRDFLIHSWGDLDNLMSNHDWDDDGGFIEEWLQVNWEFLVERELLETKGFLKSYTYDNFRITHPNAVPTHEIICKAKRNKPLIDDRTQQVISTDIKLGFGGLEKKLDLGYGRYPPFDYVTGITQDKKHFYEIYIENVDFFICPI